MKKNTIVFLRHGESQWNLENRFTGWTDVDLTKGGEAEAELAGNLLKVDCFEFDLVYTSVLKRAIKTMEICLNQMDLKNISIKYDWRLNERHYGKLQGLNKAQTAKKYGEEQVHNWRRSYDSPPPKLELNNNQHPKFDPKYNNIDPSLLPNGECLKDTINRIIPLWNDKIFSDFKLGKKILIVAHGNSIRSIIKYIDKISNQEIMKLNIPTGVPLVYIFNSSLTPIKHYYLGGQESINKKIIKVSDQGKY